MRFHRRLQPPKPAGGSAVACLVAPAAARGAARGDDQALVERIQAAVGMCMPLVAQPLLPPPCAQAVGWLPEQREQLASLLSRHAQLLLAGLAAVTAAGRAPALGHAPGVALAEQPQQPEQAAGHAVGGEPGEDPEEAAAVLLRLCASEPGDTAQSGADRRARQVAILAAGVVAQAAGQQPAQASDAALADAKRRRAAGRDGRARTANAMHRMLVALQVPADLTRLSMGLCTRPVPGASALDVCVSGCWLLMACGVHGDCICSGGDIVCFACMRLESSLQAQVFHCVLACELSQSLRRLIRHVRDLLAAGTCERSSGRLSNHSAGATDASGRLVCYTRRRSEGVPLPLCLAEHLFSF